MNRVLLPAAVACVFCAASARAVPPSHNVHRAISRPVRADTPGSPFLPITHYQALWNGISHVFFIRVQDSHGQWTDFHMTDPKEFEQVITILQNPVGAQTDGSSISTNIVAAVK